MGTHKDSMSVSLIGNAGSQASLEKILNCASGDRASSIAGLEIAYCDEKRFHVEDVWTDDGMSPALRVAFTLNPFFEPVRGNSRRAGNP
jgi:hypothetical protein